MAKHGALVCPWRTAALCAASLSVWKAGIGRNTGNDSPAHAGLAGRQAPHWLIAEDKGDLKAAGPLLRSGKKQRKLGTISEALLLNPEDCLKQSEPAPEPQQACRARGAGGQLCGREGSWASSHKRAALCLPPARPGSPAAKCAHAGTHELHTCRAPPPCSPRATLKPSMGGRPPAGTGMNVWPHVQRRTQRQGCAFRKGAGRLAPAVASQRRPSGNRE